MNHQSSEIKSSRCLVRTYKTDSRDTTGPAKSHAIFQCNLHNMMASVLQLSKLPASTEIPSFTRKSPSRDSCCWTYPLYKIFRVRIASRWSCIKKYYKHGNIILFILDQWSIHRKYVFLENTVHTNPYHLQANLDVTGYCLCFTGCSRSL